MLSGLLGIHPWKSKNFRNSGDHSLLCRKTITMASTAQRMLTVDVAMEKMYTHLRGKLNFMKVMKGKWTRCNWGFLAIADNSICWILGCNTKGFG